MKLMTSSKINAVAIKDIVNMEDIKMKLITVLVIIFFNQTALCDAPLPIPKSYNVCSSSIKYCAHVDPIKGVTVYELDDETFCGKKLYTISGLMSARAAFISEDGKYFALGSLNLVPLDANKNTIVLTIWKQGKKHKEIKLGDILNTMKSLQKTSSHYNWGSNLGFISNSNFRIKTVEGNLVSINPRTGKIEWRKSGTATH